MAKKITPKKKRPYTKSKPVSVLLRLSVKEKQGFKDAADAAGLPLATWMRERLRRITRQELEEVKQPVPF